MARTTSDKQRETTHERAPAAGDAPVAPVSLRESVVVPYAEPSQVTFSDAGPIRRRMRAVRGLVGSFSVLADWRSRRALLRAKLDARRGRAPETVTLRVKGPAPLEVEVRPGSDDIGILYEHFARGAHLPPLPGDPRSILAIVELGTSSGLALADLARRHPNARLVGVEPDADNAALARRNLAPWKDRCELVEAGVWDSDVDLVVEGADTGLFVARPATEASGEARRVRGMTMDRLLDGHMAGQVDFLHVDAAGVESRLITATADWLDRVRSITVHVYPDRGLTPEHCAEILRLHGFDVRVDVHWWGGQVFGVRG